MLSLFIDFIPNNKVMTMNILRFGDSRFFGIVKIVCRDEDIWCFCVVPGNRWVDVIC